MGLAASSPDADLGREWADAEAADASEVDEIHFRDARDRVDARIAARDARGG